MKKKIFVSLVITALFICFMSCENPIMKSWWEEHGNVNGKIDNNGVDNSNKADPVVDWPVGLKGISGQKLKNVTIPCKHTGAAGGEFTWTKPDTLLGNLRKQTYNLTFTPDDTLNYKTVTKDVEITVIELNMVQIPAGTFIMGTSKSEPFYRDNEGPQHPVTLDGFYMSEYMVTQEFYELVMGKNPSDNVYSFSSSGESETPEQFPVERVSWYDTLVFCNKLSVMMGLTPAYRIPAFNNSTDPLDWGKTPIGITDPNLPLWDTVEIVPGSNGYRLPTEAQWEYACRAGTTTAFYTGDVADHNTGWYDDWFGSVGIIIPHKVGMLPANPWGLYDMHGNFWEWCWDWYDQNYYSYSPMNNPTGPSSGNSRVARGGWFASKSDFMRSAFRGGIEYGSFVKSYRNSFRIVLP
jgi:formylglycine-generating enzyme required for sulfatase activity